jgi:hypothetical protein
METNLQMLSTPGITKKPKQIRALWIGRAKGTPEGYDNPGDHFVKVPFRIKACGYNWIGKS